MGEKKSFQEILDEQLVRAKKNAAAPAEPPTTPAPLRFEFDFSFVTQRSTITKSKLEAYPRPAIKLAPPPPARPKDQLVAIAGFSSIEIAAMKTLNLSVEKDLSRNALKAKYRALVRKCHPDHQSAHLTEAEKRSLTERFQAVLEAYQILSLVFS
jgi:DnaJ-domain-containing protein 1